MKATKILQYYHTLKYLQPKQVIGRIWGEEKRKRGFYSLPKIPQSLSGGITPKVPFLLEDPWNNSADISKGIFRFLHRTEELGWPIEWSIHNQPLLWQFNLYYFNYLHLLSPEKQQQICLQWIQANQSGNEVGMHPYPTSLRIVNWCKVGNDHSAIHNSLYKQTAFLARNTEFFHPGNHYLENARALIFAGVYFQGFGESKQWLAQGLNIYYKELPKQVLKDGGYFERSPMYHAIVLTGILDIINILYQDRKTVQFFLEYAEPMVAFLKSMTQPDGTLSLYNDSTVEISPSPESIINYAESVAGIKTQSYNNFAETGYFLHNEEDLYITIDGGAIGPDYLPAHAHADIFSYQISFQKKQFVVDSGVFGYESDTMRGFVRGTRAHNTVAVDKQNQAEVWDIFRVARRFKPYDVHFEQNGTATRFSGSFDGYAKLIGDKIVHTRKMTIEGNKIVVDDEIEGSGEHLVESLIHLHPRVSLQRTSNGVLLQRDGILCSIEYDGIGVSIEHGWYCPEFGKKIPNQVIVFHNNGAELPSNIKYSFRFLS